MLIPPCSELLERERPGENWLKTKQNNQIRCSACLHCWIWRASSRWEHQPGQDGHSQSRQSQVSLGCVPEQQPDSLAGQQLQPVPPALSFWDFNYSQNQGRKDQAHKQKALSCLDRQVGYFSQKPLTPEVFHLHSTAVSRATLQLLAGTWAALGKQDMLLWPEGGMEIIGK